MISLSADSGRVSRPSQRDRHRRAVERIEGTFVERGPEGDGATEVRREKRGAPGGSAGGKGPAPPLTAARRTALRAAGARHGADGDTTSPTSSRCRGLESRRTGRPACGRRSRAHRSRAGRAARGSMPGLPGAGRHLDSSIERSGLPAEVTMSRNAAPGLGDELRHLEAGGAYGWTTWSAPARRSFSAASSFAALATMSMSGRAARRQRHEEVVDVRVARRDEPARGGEPGA